MDVYDKNFGDLEDNHKEEIIRIYRGYANYYSDITKYSTNLLTNWLFALNTGSIIGVISFLNNKETNVPDIYWATFIWIIGIISIFLSVKFEKWKFDHRGDELDLLFKNLQLNKITGLNFLREIKKSSFLYKWILNPGLFETMSFIFWIIGIFFIILPFYLKNSIFL